MRRPLLLTALAILLVAAAGAARAEIYHWTDATGTPHFSDRAEDVPPEYRQQLPEALRSPATDAAKPSAGKAKPGLLARTLSAVRPEHAASRSSSTSRGSAAGRLDLSKLAVLRHLGLGTWLAIFVGVIGFSFVFYALLIQLACRICREEVPALGRALAVTGVEAVLGVGLAIIELAILGMAGAVNSPLVKGVNALLGFATNVAVLRAMLGQTLGKAIAVQLVTVVVSLAIGVALLLGLLFLFGGMSLLHAGA